MDLNEFLKHPISTLLSIFNLHRIGPFPTPPVIRTSPYGLPQEPSKAERRDAFERPSTNVAETIYRRVFLSRIEKYAIYQEMDRDPLVGEVLNAYAEAVTQINYQKGVVVWAEAKNQEVADIVNKMYKAVGLHIRAFSMVRDMFKMGDNFDGIVYTPTSNGVVALKPYDAWKVARVEDEFYRLMGYAPAGNEGQPVDIEGEAVPPYDILHLRLISKDRKSSYGSSLFDSAWEKWEDLQSMEDQLVLQRLLRRPDRLMILMDTTGMGYQEAFEQIRIWEKYLYQEINLDTTNRRLEARGTPMAENRDLILPRGPDNRTEIQNFPSTTGNDLFRDLELILGRFLGAVGMDKGYFGFEGGQYRMEQSLPKQDVRFAKRAMRGQFNFLSGCTELGMIHLALQGMDPMREENFFESHGMPISTFMEIEYNELLQMRFDLVDRMGRTSDDLGLNRSAWVRWVLENVAKFPNDLIDTLLSTEATESLDPGKVREAGEAYDEKTQKLMSEAMLIDEAESAAHVPSGATPEFSQDHITQALSDSKLLTEGKESPRTWSESIFENTDADSAHREFAEKRCKDRLDRLKNMAASIG
jgi:hypothetical protein